MKIKKAFALLLVFILAACSAPAVSTAPVASPVPAATTNGPVSASTPPPAVETAPSQSPTAPAVESSSSGGFSARATSPISVSLDWAGISANSFRLEVGVTGSDFLPLASLPGGTRVFEHFPALANTSLRYRLTPENGIPLTITVQTPPQMPDPLTVTLVPDIQMPDLTTQDFSNFDPNTFNPNDLSSLGLEPTLVSDVKEIGPQGGTLSIASSTGAKYTYTIPAGALDDSFVFSLKPLARLEGAPLTGGLLGAVVVEPVGLELNLPAVLTITPPDGTTIARDELLATFDFYPDGSEFAFTGAYRQPPQSQSPGSFKLAAPAHQTDNWVMKPWDIPQQRTGPAGTGKTTRSAVKQQAIQHPPTDPQTKDAQNRAAIDDEELTPLPDLSYMNINKDSGSLSGWKDTLDLMSQMETRYTNAANKKDALDKMKMALDNLVNQFEKNFKKNLENCVSKDDFDAYFAANALKGPRSPFAKIIAERYKNAYGSATIDKILEKAANCSLRLQIESTATLTGPGTKIQLAVTATVPLEIHYDKSTGSVYYSGSGAITYLTNQIKAAECQGKYETPASSKFVVNDLRPVFAASSNQLTDFNLGRYSTPGSFDKIKIKCPRARAFATLPRGSDMWGGYFTLSRFENLTINEFRVQLPPPAGDLASKEPTDTRKIGEGNLEVKSKFKLVVNSADSK